MSESRAEAVPASAGIASGAGVAARYLAIAIGFTLPVSTALDNVLLGLLLACWLASGRTPVAPWKSASARLPS